MAQAGRGTNEQKLFLVAYMEKHPGFCQREFTSGQGQVDHRNQWHRLAEMLNNVPNGAYKTADQWQRVRGSLT